MIKGNNDTNGTSAEDDGDKNTVKGANNLISGSSNIVMGDKNDVDGDYNLVITKRYLNQPGQPADS